VAPTTFRPRLFILVDTSRVAASAKQLFWLPNGSLHFSSDTFCTLDDGKNEHTVTIETQMVVVVVVKVTRLDHIQSTLHFFLRYELKGSKHVDDSRK
jgi:hypothetical protein